MPPALYALENDTWQVGILPETGGSVAYGRVRSGERYVDVMRPTAESDFGNASQCASFIMLPWANRLRDARFRFDGADYALEPTSSDGTAIHGAVRRMPWRVVSADRQHIRMMFDSSLYEKVNFPFEFSAEAEYRLNEADFIMTLTVRNEDKRAFPCGFGHHPYFLTAPESDENRVQLEIPCRLEYRLENSLVTAPPYPVQERNDYRTLRPLGTEPHDDLLTGRIENRPMRMRYPQWNTALEFHADPLFQHVILFAPPGKPFFALEPQTNANDGFNLLAKGQEGSGVFILQPGQEQHGACSLRSVSPD